MASSTIVALLLMLAIASQTTAATYNIVHLTEYVRHGARTTWSNHMNLPFTKVLGTGNITANGMRMHFILGSQLRKNYPMIFDDKYNPTDVQVQSSSVYRCIMSAMSHLMGTYPLGTGDKFTLQNGDQKGLPPWENLQASFSNDSALPQAFRPFPYSVLSEQIDYMFFPSMLKSCPNANQYGQKLTNEKVAKYSYLVKSIGEELNAAGYNSKKFYNEEWTVNTVSYLYDEFKSYFNYYGKLYGGISQDLFDRMFRIANLNFKFLFADEKMERLMSDAVARDIIAGMDDKIAGTSKLRFRLFAGHDTGVFNHMLRFNLTDEQCMLDLIEKGKTTRRCEDIPDFASSFLYELATDINGKYFVKVLLNGKPFQVCDKDDQFYCDYATFKAKMSEMLFYDAEDKLDFCANPLAQTFDHNNSNHSDIKILIYAVTGILVLSLVAVVFLIRMTSNIDKMTDVGDGYRQSDANEKSA